MADKPKLNGWVRMVGIVVVMLIASLAWVRSYGALEERVKNNCDSISHMHEKLDEILERLPPKDG